MAEDLIRRAMSELGKRRWAGVSADERRRIMAVVQAKRTGKRRLTAEQRREIGRRLAAGRAAARARRA